MPPAIFPIILAVAGAISTTGDTLRLAVTKTPECQAYRIACVPASMANALTSDAVVAQYFDLYVGGDKFTEDFTNAVLEYARRSRRFGGIG